MHVSVFPCVCRWVCTRVCSLHVCALHMWGVVYTCMCLCTRVQMVVCMCVDRCACVCVHCMCVHMYVCGVYTCVWMDVCMLMDVCMWMGVCMWMVVHTCVCSLHLCMHVCVHPYLVIIPSNSDSELFNIYHPPHPHISPACPQLTRPCEHNCCGQPQ